MAVFSYKALDSSHRAVKGTISGDSPRHARDLLRGQGLRVHQITPANERSKSRTASFSMPSSFQSQLSSFVSELSTLLAVGVPVAEALDTLIQQNRGRFRTALLLMRDRVTSGASLAEAMSEQTNVFDHFTISMVEVGENSGTLDEVLARLAKFKSRIQELKSKVVTALMYPCIVLVISLCVTLFLMTYVVPMLLENLIDAEQDLPWPTVALKSFSDFLTEYGLIALFFAAIAGALVVLGIRTDSGKRIWHRFLLRIPILGSMILKQEVSRVALVIATLSRSGITLLSAMETASRSTKNALVKDALNRCTSGVKSGQDVGDALAVSELFPQMVIHIFAVGQKSGQLEPMLERLSDDYDRQVSIASARLTAILEPLLIVVLAFIVGFILFATMLPILEAGNVL